MHRLLVLVGGIAFLAVLLIVQDRIQLLLGVFFFGIIFNPDKYFVLVEKCSWSDGISLSLVEIIFGMLVIFYFLEKRDEILDKRFFLPHLDLPMLLLLLASVLSLFNSPDALVSSFQIVTFFKLLVFYFFFTRILRSRDVSDVLFLGLMVMIGIQFIFLLASIPLSGGISDLRFSGTFANPNSLAEVYAPSLVILLTLLISGTLRKFRVLAIAAVFMNFLILLFTLSRGGWLSAFAAICLLLIIMWREGMLDQRKVLVLAVFVVLFLAIFHQEILSRLHFGDESAQSRLYLDKMAFQMIKAHPVWGIGVNNFPFVMKRYYFPGLQVNEWLHTVHNQYLLVWSEMGLPGIISFLWLLGGGVYYGRRVYQSGHETRFVGLALFLAILVSALHMMVDMYVALPNLIFLWTVFSAIAALYVNINRFGKKQNE